MLETNSLSYKYKGGTVLRFKDLFCEPGTKLLVSGESGTGKTTLLHLIAGILRPATGSISIGGTIISDLPSAQADKFRGIQIGMIFQQHLFLQGLTVYENLLAARRLAGLEPDNTYLDELVRALGIESLKDEKPESLSQGEQQRFSIARALSNKPILVLADEPTSSLDDKNCIRFASQIETPIAGNHPSWVMATHDQRLKAYADQIYELEEKSGR